MNALGRVHANERYSAIIMDEGARLPLFILLEQGRVLRLSLFLRLIGILGRLAVFGGFERAEARQRGRARFVVAIASRSAESARRPDNLSTGRDDTLLLLRRATLDLCERITRTVK